MRYISCIVALLVVFNCEGRYPGRYYAGRPGSQGSGGGDGSGESNWYFTVEAGSHRFYKPPFFQPNHSTSRTLRPAATCNPAGMTAQKLKTFFAQNQWSSDQILSNPKWLMHDSFVAIAKTLPEYGKYIDDLYEQWNCAGDGYKLWGRITRSYTPGLEAKIRALKRERDEIVVMERIALLGAVARQKQEQERQEVERVFHEQLPDLEAIAFDVPCDSKTTPHKFLPAADKRSNAIQTITQNGAAYKQEKYEISDDVQTFIQTSGCNSNLYRKCYGNQLQQVIHQEQIDLIETTASLPLSSGLYVQRPAIVELIDSAREYNQAGSCYPAMEINDFCFSLLEYGTAVVQGAVQGVVGVAQYAVDHPVETAAWVVASELAFAYQVGTILTDIGGIGITYMCDAVKGKERLDEYLEPLNALIDGINNRQIRGPDVVRGVTQFAVAWKAQSKLLNGLGTFYKGIKTNVTKAIKNNPHITMHEYAQTPEGQIYKVIINPDTEKKFDELVQLAEKSSHNENIKATQLITLEGKIEITDDLILKIISDPSVDKYVEEFSHMTDYPAHNRLHKQTLSKALNIKELAFRIKGLTQVIKCTRHGIIRLIKRGFTPEDVKIVINHWDEFKIQADGAKVFIKKLASGENNFIVLNELTEEVVTCGKNFSAKKLNKLAENYGWK